MLVPRVFPRCFRYPSLHISKTRCPYSVGVGNRCLQYQDGQLYANLRSACAHNLALSHLEFGFVANLRRTSALNTRPFISIPDEQHLEPRRDGWCALRNKNVALFIDADFFGLDVCKQIVSRHRSSKAELVACKVYMNRHKAAIWGEECSSLGMDVVVVHRWEGGTKDPGDIELAMDVVQLAQRSFSSCNPQERVDIVVIAAIDVDFALVHRRVRLFGLCSLAVAVRFAGRIAKPVRKELAAECSGILEIDEEGGCQAIGQPTVAHAEVLRRLIELRYSPETSTMLFRSAINLFLQHNGVHDLIQAHAPFVPLSEFIPILHARMFASSAQAWRPRSPGLICIEGQTNKRDKGKTNRNYPETLLCVKISPTIVDDVLVGLGYLDKTNNDDVFEAIHLFLLMNTYGKLAKVTQALLDRNLDIDSYKFHLYYMFVDESVPLQVRLPRKDAEVRKMLKMNDASKTQLTNAMIKHVKSKGVLPARTYNMLVWQCLQKDVVDIDPSRRRAWIAEEA